MNYLKTAGQIMIAAAALALASSADAAEKKTIGMVFKVLNNAFTPPLQQGCAQAAKDLNVDCIFVGPTEYNEAQEVQMVQDMIQRGVRRSRRVRCEPQSNGENSQTGPGKTYSGGYV